MAMLIKQTIASENAALQERVACMLKELLKKNILHSVKEQLETHAKQFDAVFNKLANLQLSVEQLSKICLDYFVKLLHITLEFQK